MSKQGLSVVDQPGLKELPQGSSNQTSLGFCSLQEGYVTLYPSEK
jgi:hypothetical protein